MLANLKASMGSKPKPKAADVWRGDVAYHEGKTLDSLVDHCKERNLDPRIVLAALTQVAPGDVFRRIVGGRKREYRHAALLSDVEQGIVNQKLIPGWQPNEHCRGPFAKVQCCEANFRALVAYCAGLDEVCAFELVHEGDKVTLAQVRDEMDGLAKDVVEQVEETGAGVTNAVNEHGDQNKEELKAHVDQNTEELKEQNARLEAKVGYLADVVEGLVYRLEDGGLLALGGQQPQRQPPALEGVQSDNLPEPDSTEAGWGSSGERAAGVDAAPLRLPRDSIFPNDQLSPQSWTPRAVPTEDGLSEEEEKVEAPESTTPPPLARPAEDLNGGETVFTPARVVSDWDKERLEAARSAWKARRKKTALGEKYPSPPVRDCPKEGKKKDPNWCPDKLELNAVNSTP
jgi:hypothetical protein